MDMMEAMRLRHSVRKYTGQPIPDEAREQLRAEIERINRETGLHIQLITGETRAFSGMLAHYGGFSGVNSYLAMVGKKTPDLEEKCGWYGEELVLKAQMLGLNTCWTALTYRKVPGVIDVSAGEKLVIVIAIGPGETQGVPHRSKPAEVFSTLQGAPEWYLHGLEAAMLAPTAVNQQKFRFSLQGDTVTLTYGHGPCAAIDKGIIRFHFELGAGKENFRWG